MANKLLVVIYGVKNSGKTSICREFYNKYLTNSDKKETTNKDFTDKGYLDEIRVGVISFGDPDASTCAALMENLEAYKDDVDALVVACRKGKKPYDSIKNFADAHSFKMELLETEKSKGSESEEEIKSVNTDFARKIESKIKDFFNK
jgi:AAA+ ATPase superfamily predicted ATPase